ncbi:serine protease [Photobacterium sp. SDRW27]|uniref:serine protease n=1 Tax=Photobacterium obscurum TaxID=2829490 RepID=UPI0022443D85|nr:serine protease [Photobacterium obscurum]MCW8330366.1 serine protease [Photobacterium obscurum]
MKQIDTPRSLFLRLHAALLSLLLISTFFLSGCIMSNGPVSQASSSNANQMVMIGVPLLLGGFGSAVPVNEQYMITAKHVAQLSWDFDVIHHPYCDLSLIRRHSDYVPTWGLIYPDQPVSHHGHSVLGNKIKGDGKYLQDVIDTNTDCLYSLSDAPVMSGMSGGPVFNQNGEIAGITVAIVHNPEDLENLRPAIRYSQFVPATLIFDWLDSLDIEVSSASTELASVQVSDYVASLNQPNRTVTNTASVRANAAPTSNEIPKNNINQFSSPNNPNDIDTTASQISSRTPVTSTYFPPSKRRPQENSAEALSGISNEPETEPQLTSKQQKHTPMKP